MNKAYTSVLLPTKKWIRAGGRRTTSNSSNGELLEPVTDTKLQLENGEIGPSPERKISTTKCVNFFHRSNAHKYTAQMKVPFLEWSIDVNNKYKRSSNWNPSLKQLQHHHEAQQALYHPIV